MLELILMWIFIIAFTVGVILYFIIRKIKKNKLTKKILDTSRRIQLLLALNESFVYYKSIEKCYEFTYYCKSLAQLKNFDLNRFFINSIDKNLDQFCKIIFAIDFNRTEYAKYYKSAIEIKSYVTEDDCISLKTDYDEYIEIENNLFVKNLINPTRTTNIKCIVEYSSPAGRNFFERHKSFNFDDICDGINKVKELRIEKESQEYKIKMERQKLTNSLRYDVLRRDKFQCQICGATIQDGVKLHVDHIIPVSKGGKTTIENLRTLCDRCNLGKSDKIEEI